MIISTHALFPGPIADGVRAVTIGTWIVATVWIPVLVYVAFRRSVGAWLARGVPARHVLVGDVCDGGRDRLAVVHDVSLAFFWIAFAAWLTVAVISVRRRTLIVG